jgi:hypothetical protein
MLLRRLRPWIRPDSQKHSLKVRRKVPFHQLDLQARPIGMLLGSRREDARERHRSAIFIDTTLSGVECPVEGVEQL